MNTRPKGQRRQRSFVFEVTQRCNHDCPHCYNVWKNASPYPCGELGTSDTLVMLGRMLEDTGVDLVTLTGGESLLRQDIHEIIDYLLDRSVTVNLISNGSLLNSAMIQRLLPDKISVFELPLLSCHRAIHDRLSGVEGAFDRKTPPYRTSFAATVDRRIVP